MKRITLPLFLFSLLLLSAATPFKSAAQQKEKPNELLDALEDFFQQDYLSIDMLIQSQGEFHWEPASRRENTFRVPTARLKVYGALDDNFSYVLQGDVTNSPALLDAKIKYEYANKFSITAGAQKPGISAEYLTPSSSTDFINRSRIVSALVNRDIGVLAGIKLMPDVTLSAGMFNGTNQNLINNNNQFYYTARLEVTSVLSDESMVILGANIGHGIENGTNIGNIRFPAINGERTIYGGDIRLESGRLLLSSELLAASLEYTPTLSDTILGYHITGGYQAADNLQVLLRFDHLDANTETIYQPNLLLAGMNYNFTDAVSFQLNYQINPEDLDFGNHVLLAQIQIAF